MDLALGFLKLAALLLALLLVPMAILLATPFVLIWPPPEGSLWRPTILSRYRKVVKVACFASSVLEAVVP